MNYTFNATIAQKFGVHEALFIHNLHWWIQKNQEKGSHFHDGKTWTYNSVPEFAEVFPFFTQDQLRRIIEKLDKKGAITIGNYNRTKADRTRWYALSDEILQIYRTERQLNYTFNATIAQKFSVHEALFIHNLHWWIQKNQQEGTHFHDGKTWTYNSVPEFAEVFPFFTQDQLGGIIKKLDKKGAITIGNYNRTKVDRTRWYALSDEILQIYDTEEQMQTAQGTAASGKKDECNGQEEPLQEAKPLNKNAKCNRQEEHLQPAKLPDASDENAPPVPYSNPIVNSNINTEREAGAGGRGGSDPTDPQPHLNKSGGANPENKKHYAPHVSMTEAQYALLEGCVGKQGAVRCIEMLENYKVAHGKKYYDDYATMHRWVIKQYKQDQQEANQQPQSSYDTASLEAFWATLPNLRQTGT